MVRTHKSTKEHRAKRLEKRVEKQQAAEEAVKARLELQQRILDIAPAKGTNPLADVDDKQENWFKNYPLSYETQQGLFNAGYIKSTAIQHATLLHALCGRDLLAAAKTGSGKSLAFLIPVLEKLYHARWNPDDGLGALIITPTRELATYLFKILTTIGAKHGFSAGILFGGKQILDEKESIAKMNILIATPGRLLHHMDTTAGFNCDYLRILVIDEADRLLQEGFADELNNIISFLPSEKQTLLFSATQTRNIKDLMRLRLKTPEFISDMRDDAYTLPPPEQLQQSVMVVPLWEKMNCLWSFLKAHVHSKVVVFLSTGKQIRYVHAVFSKMRVGKKVYTLHGSMNQAKRLAMYGLFESTPNTVLLATDVAARGLDFPAVDWILQLDCPDTPETYIHRVGRTARYTAKGKSLLLLTPQEEEGMMSALAKVNVHPKRIKLNPAKQLQTGDALASVMAKYHQALFLFTHAHLTRVIHPDIKILALKAFVTYFKFVFMQQDKNTFNIQKLPSAEYAKSLGLLAVPTINISGKSTGQESINQLESYEREANRIAEKEAKLAEHLKRLEEEENKEDAGDEKKKPKTKLQKLLERKNLVQENPLLKSITKHESDDEEILVSKKGDPLKMTQIGSSEGTTERPLSKRAKLKLKRKALVQPTTGERLKFFEDENGELVGTQVNVLKPPPNVTPLEYFSRVFDELQSKDKDDRVRAGDIRRQKKYDAMDRAAEREREKKLEKLKEQGLVSDDDEVDYEDEDGDSEGEYQDDNGDDAEDGDNAEDGEDDDRKGSNGYKHTNDEEDEEDEEENEYVRKPKPTKSGKRKRAEVQDLDMGVEDLEARAMAILEQKLKSRKS